LGEFVSVRYKTKLSEAVNHVKYIAFREREIGGQYGIFNEHSDNVDVKKFTDSLNDKRTAHPSVAKVHTLIFSMSGDEWERSGFQEGDYQEMVRRMMKDWQLERGIKVDWVAAVHPEPGHPHVHVAIKSVYTDRDGVERRLKMDIKEERAWFKQAFRHEKNRIRGFDLPEYEYERDRERGSKIINKEPDFGKDLLNNLVYQIKMRQLEAERQKEYEMQRAHERGRSR
jgi:hypothetical protein